MPQTCLARCIQKPPPPATSCTRLDTNGRCKAFRLPSICRNNNSVKHSTGTNKHLPTRAHQNKHSAALLFPPQRFNNGKSYATRSHGNNASPPPASEPAQGFAAPPVALLETDTHSVLRAGAVPATAATAAARSSTRCSGRVMDQGWVGNTSGLVFGEAGLS